MPNDNETSLEEARRCALVWVVRLRAKVHGILSHELFQWTAVFDDKEDKEFKQSFLQRFGSPEITDPIQAMIYAYEKYRQSLESLHGVLEKSSVITQVRDEPRIPDSSSTIYRGRPPRYTQ